MPSQTKTALRTATGLATLAFTLHSHHSLAAQDFFALPAGSDQSDPDDPFAQTSRAVSATAGTEIIFADVDLNGERVTGIARLRLIDGRMAIDSGFAFANGIVKRLPDEPFLFLDAIDGVAFEFDELAQRLTLRVPLQSTGQNLVTLTARPTRAVQANSELPALIVEYDLSAQADSSGTGMSGLVAPRVVKGNLAVESAWRFTTGHGEEPGNVTRLDSVITLRDPDRVASASIGDFVSQMPSGSRAVRMGGIRIGTDFALRPDLVTQPLPDFTDSVAVPSGIDVLINDRRVGGADILPGEFTVQDIPVQVGRGRVGVVVRDALGREVLQTVDFYGSRRLLALGLVEAAVNLGAIRRRYGARSNDYGPFAVSTMFRKGLSDRFTGTLLGEASRSVRNLGAQGDVQVGNIGILSVTMRASRADYFTTGAHGGSLVGVGFESLGPGVSYSMEYRKVSTFYADIASASGDAPPPSLLAANINFDLAEHGRLRFSAIRQTRRASRDPQGPALTTRLLSANYRRRLSRTVNLSLDASYRRGPQGEDGITVLAGVTMAFGGRRFGQVAASHNQGRNFVQAGFYNPDINPGDFGYSIAASRGDVDRVAASISHQQGWARMDAAAELVGSSLAARFGIRGALIAVDGAVFASRNSGGSYVLVDAGGIEGVEISRENRVAGVTDGGGRLLIDQVPGYVRTKFGVDPARLPLDVIAASIEEYVTAAPRSVARVELALTRHEPLAMRLTDPRGRDIAPGTSVTAYPSQTRYIVGFDGMVEINAALDDDEIAVTEGDGSLCRAALGDLAEPANDNALPVLRCFMRTRSFAIGQPPAEPRPDRTRPQ
ncbi:fimbria/pilus outer membrane usher protein [Qipengyuania nanhaisediminis]|uniref:fimbria/pilus outer membrane usher protein n=1 Tax=Qipengyuania nanhaisediminis TaxID=604088 RepID=UPI0038B31377